MNLEKTIQIVIILVIFYTIWNLVFVHNISVNNKLVDVPYDLKCLFNDPDCAEGDIDEWSLIQAGIYFIIGMIVPDSHVQIIGISIIVEFIDPILGIKPKYVIEPLLNITAYSIGSLLFHQL